MNDQQIFELSDRLKAAKEMKRELEDKVKEVNREIEEVDAALSDKMAEEEVDKFSRNGATFYLNSRLYVSAQAGRKEDLISALKKNGYGDIVTETVNERLESLGGKLPGLFLFFTRRTICRINHNNPASIRDVRN